MTLLLIWCSIGLLLAGLSAWLTYQRHGYAGSWFAESLAILSFCLICVLAWPLVILAGWHESRRRKAQTL